MFVHLCLYLRTGFFFFFFFFIPQLDLWGSPFGVRFLSMLPFFSPTMEVVAFHLCRWCMLGVSLLLPFTRLGHECQDLLSPCEGMHMCTDWSLVYTLIRKSFWGMEPEPMLTPREKSRLPENFPQRKIKPMTLHQTGQRAQHATNKLFGSCTGLNLCLFSLLAT